MTQPPGSGAAFAPAHITGFFVICPHENPAMAGSLGCGITLEAGITTRVEIGGSAGPDDSPCPTIGSVVSRLVRRRCSVRITSSIPIGAGFGASGAGALGTAFALNRALSFDLTANQLTGIAHIAEVENRTGSGTSWHSRVGGWSSGARPELLHDSAGYSRMRRMYSGSSLIKCQQKRY